MKFLIVALTTLGLVSASNLVCPQGQVPDINRICVEAQYIEGCHVYKSSDECETCQFRYRKNESGTCEYAPTLGGPCCLKKDAEGKCKECNIGMFVNSEGICEQSSIIGCLSKNSHGRCTNCASNYILSDDGECEEGIKHCVQYNSTGSTKVCENCQTGYSMINNMCLKNKILGCQTEENHTCFKCYEPFNQRDNHCEIANCVTYNEYGCTHCDCGFYLTPKNVCKQILKGCIRYQRGVCTDCHPNFRLKGGSCVIEGCENVEGLNCTKCKEQYDLQGDTCRMKNCLSWNDGSCQICEAGFSHFEGKCIEQQQNKLILMNQPGPGTQFQGLNAVKMDDTRLE